MDTLVGGNLAGLCDSHAADLLEVHSMTGNSKVCSRMVKRRENIQQSCGRNCLVDVRGREDGQILSLQAGPVEAA